MLSEKKNAGLILRIITKMFDLAGGLTIAGTWRSHAPFGSHRNKFNETVEPMLVSKSIYAIRDSLSKANISSDLVILDFSGLDFKQDKLFCVNIDCQMNKRDIPFIK